MLTKALLTAIVGYVTLYQVGAPLVMTYFNNVPDTGNQVLDEAAESLADGVVRALWIVVAIRAVAIFLFLTKLVIPLLPIPDGKKTVEAAPAQ